MPNKKLYKTIKLGAFSGLFYAGGLAMYDYGDRVDFRLGKFIFDFLFFGGAMGWIAHINFNRPKKEN